MAKSIPFFPNIVVIMAALMLFLSSAISLSQINKIEGAIIPGVFYSYGLLWCAVYTGKLIVIGFSKKVLQRIEPNWLVLTGLVACNAILTMLIDTSLFEFVGFGRLGGAPATPDNHSLRALIDGTLIVTVMAYLWLFRRFAIGILRSSKSN